MSWYNLPPIRFEAHNGIANAKNGVCPNCGAQVNSVSLLCEYCGTHFTEDMIPIVVERPEVKILQSMYRVDLRTIEAFKEDPSFESHIQNEIAYNMAKELLKQMQFDEEIDYSTYQKIIRARLRVVDKEFHF